MLKGLPCLLLGAATAVADYKAFVDYECAIDEWRNPDPNRPAPKSFPARAQDLEDLKEINLPQTAQQAAEIECLRLQLRLEGKSKDEIKKELEPYKNSVYVLKAWFRKVLPDFVPPKDQSVGKTNKERDLALKVRGRSFLERMTFALVGGLVLLAPMLIMRLHPDLPTVILTTSAFVVVVGILLAARLPNAEPKDIVGASAAYAAVLVVFVGQGKIPEKSTLGNGELAGIAVGTIVGTSVTGAVMFTLLESEKVIKEVYMA